MKLAAALLAMTTALSANAKTFTNSYVSFDLPDKWNCNLEQTEWVCSPGNAAEQQLATIILTAKEVGPADSLPAYKAHLQTPKQITGRAGNIITSEILTVEDKKIADQPWVDGFHKSSEIQAYLTRYLATTQGRIAVLVTFTAHQLHYSKYSQDFNKAIASLRAIAPKQLSNKGGAGGGDGPFGTVGSAEFAGGDVALPEEGGPGGGGKSAFGGKTRMVLVLAILLAAVGGYLMIKKNKKKR